MTILPPNTLPSLLSPGTGITGPPAAALSSLNPSWSWLCACWYDIHCWKSSNTEVRQTLVYSLQVLPRQASFMVAMSRLPGCVWMLEVPSTTQHCRDCNHVLSIITEFKCHLPCIFALAKYTPVFMSLPRLNPGSSPVSCTAAAV